jgi:predicted transcriptional regulator
MRKLRRQSRKDEIKIKDSDTNGTQSEHKNDKKHIIGTQTVNKRYPQPDTKGNTNGTQSEHKNDKKHIIGTQTVNKRYSQPDTKGNTNGTQSEHKTNFSALTGNQRKVTQFLYDLSKYSSSRLTKKVTIQHISENTKIPKGSIKTTIARLKQKNVISLAEYKDGRGGYCKYILNESIFNEILRDNESKRYSIGTQTVNKRYPQPNTQPDTSPSSSNSNILLNNTITTKPSKNYDWLQDIQTPENLKSLGFGVSHIKQLKEKFSITPEEIQNGLEAFSFDLAQGELERLKARGIQNIIGYFFGAMKSGGYNSVSDGFISAEELAEKEMLERLERKQVERKERKEKLEALLFEEWLETKNKDEILEIERPVSGYLDIIHRAGLKDYFLKNEFDNFKKELQ